MLRAASSAEMPERRADVRSMRLHAPRRRRACADRPGTRSGGGSRAARTRRWSWRCARRARSRPGPGAAPIESGPRVTRRCRRRRGDGSRRRARSTQQRQVGRTGMPNRLPSSRSRRARPRRRRPWRWCRRRPCASTLASPARGLGAQACVPNSGPDSMVSNAVVLPIRATPPLMCPTRTLPRQECSCLSDLLGPVERGGQRRVHVGVDQGDERAGGVVGAQQDLGCRQRRDRAQEVVGVLRVDHRDDCVPRVVLERALQADVDAPDALVEAGP